MSNPYRARPGRLRADHTSAAIPKYGVQNQNSWSSMGSYGPQQAANVYPSNQPVVNQPASKTAGGDPWDWGCSDNIDNGNDAWNWSIDQSAATTETSHSHQQTPQQQFVPPYPNLRPPSQNLVQDNHYSSNININGNKNTSSNNNPNILPMHQHHQLAGGNMPRTDHQTRESTPSQSDSYNQQQQQPPQQQQQQYTNYNINQQPPRTSSAKSTSSISENQANIQHFNNSYFAATPSPFDLTNNPSQQHPSNTYNWNENDQTSRNVQSDGQYNWPSNQVPQNTNYWHDQTKKEEVVNAVDNQWKIPQPPQPYQQQQQSPKSQMQLQEPHSSSTPLTVTPNIQPQLAKHNETIPEDLPQDTWHGNYYTDKHQIRRPSEDANLSSSQWSENSHEMDRSTDQGNEIQNNSHFQYEKPNVNLNQYWPQPHFQVGTTWQEKAPELQKKTVEQERKNNRSPEDNEIREDYERKTPMNQSLRSFHATRGNESLGSPGINKKAANLASEEHISVFSGHDQINQSIPCASPDLSVDASSSEHIAHIQRENSADGTTREVKPDSNMFISDLTSSVNALNLTDKSQHQYNSPMQMPPNTAAPAHVSMEEWQQRSAFNLSTLDKSKEALGTSKSNLGQSPEPHLQGTHSAHQQQLCGHITLEHSTNVTATSGHHSCVVPQPEHFMYNTMKPAIQPIAHEYSSSMMHNSDLSIIQPHSMPHPGNSALENNATSTQFYAKPSAENYSHILSPAYSTSQVPASKFDEPQSSSTSIGSMKPMETTSPRPSSSYDGNWCNKNAMKLTPQNNWYSNTENPASQTNWSTTTSDSITETSSLVDTTSSNLHDFSAATEYEQITSSESKISKESISTAASSSSSPPPPPLSTMKSDPYQQHQSHQQSSHLQMESHSENYEFASNDRNTFLETGELTDSSHHDADQDTITSAVVQDDENDEVSNDDIPFIREVPGQSSSTDPQRSIPTGQEQYLQPQSNAFSMINHPRRNDLSGQEQIVQSLTSGRITTELRRDVPPGQERSDSMRPEPETLERRNDPSGREQSLPPLPPSRNDPSGEERTQSQNLSPSLEPSEIREIPGSRANSSESLPNSTSEVRTIPGGSTLHEPSSSDDPQHLARVVPGSQQALTSGPSKDVSNDVIGRSKREEAVGASIRESPGLGSDSPKRRESYEEGDNEESGNNSLDDEHTRERCRKDENVSERLRNYNYDRKAGERGERGYFDRDRKYNDDYYYDRQRGHHDYDRSYNSREDLDRRDASFRDGDRRRHASRDDLDDRRRLKDDNEVERERRGRDDRHLWDESRRREREYDSRYSRDPRDRDHLDRGDRRDRRDGRRRWYDMDYDSRDPPRDGRRDYYDDPYSKISSRPSSRSSYNDRDRDYYMRARDQYYGYNAEVYGAYDWSGANNYNANYYAYLENLRRTNPAAYMEWYNKYYASQQQQQQQQQHSVLGRSVSAYPEDRASVHSGRSSCEDRTTSGKQTIGDISLLEDARAVSRLTPTKFSTSHIKASFSIGSLVHVHASYPADGERARVDILRLDSLLSQDPVARELRAYPGPLIKGVTHKKTIIEYCEAKIKKAANDELSDHASYILLYQLMIMLIQQNGNVVGVDIATLLLRNKESYPYEQNKVHHETDHRRRESTTILLREDPIREASPVLPDAEKFDSKDNEVQRERSVEQITDEFRNTLLYGLVQEALEYAMNEGLWGHALFLASKLDKRSHASVMTRFANSLTAHDPLQTLYQLHSGRVPASVTCVADPKWDDWRPHLAMIISNTSTSNPEINRRAISTLGDTLAARGDLYAAHFCYILAQIEFGNYGSHGVKVVLIGANHCKSYSEFATSESIMLTEIYEYARNLSELSGGSGFILVGLQTFKLEIAQKLIDYGFIEKALLYLEQIACNIVNEPSKYKQSFINDVYTLSERIKFHDPIFKDCADDNDTTALAWLYNLREIVVQCQSGEIIQDTSAAVAAVATSTSATVNARDTQNNPADVQVNQPQYNQFKQQNVGQQWNYNTETQDYATAPVSMMEVPTIDINTQDQWQPMSLPTVQDTYNSHEQNIQYTQSGDQYQHQVQPDYWGQQYKQTDYQGNYATGDWQTQQSANTIYSQEQSDVDSAAQQSGGWNYEPKPQISMGPSMGSKQYDPLEELDLLESPGDAKPSAETKKSMDKSMDKKSSNSSGSWFGGLFSKLTPKPKNQMILPDDNNPTIVWDPVAKKWMNKEEEGDGGASSHLAPPPKMSELNLKSSPQLMTTPAAVAEQMPLAQDPVVQPPSTDSTTPNTSKLISGSSNMFKLQRGRSMRNNYIDVMNRGGVKSNGQPGSGISTQLTPMAASSPQLFVPAPLNDPNAPVDFLTPTPTTIPSNDPVSQELSRWSSASSLSREVQSYTMKDPRLHQRI